MWGTSSFTILDYDLLILWCPNDDDDDDDDDNDDNLVLRR